MMEFFRDKSRSTALLREGKLKNKKLKQAKDAATEMVIEMKVAILITKDIRDKLDKRLKPLVVAAESEANEDLPISSVDLTEEYEANVNFFNAGNFSGQKAKVQVGQKTGRPSKVKLTKISVKDKEAFLVMNVTSVFIEELWAWIPKIFGSGEFVIELIPHQGELNFEGAEPEEGKKGKSKDNNLVPVRPAGVKKKTKVKSATKKTTFKPERQVRSALGG